MADITDVETIYKYALQDLGSQLETINTVPTTDVRDKAIASAVDWFSQRIPAIESTLYDPAEEFIELEPESGPFVRVLGIECPVDQSPVSYLPDSAMRDVKIVQKDGTFYVNVPNTVTGSRPFRLINTALQQGIISGDDIPQAWASVVGKKAAQFACEAFGARYANSVANNLDAVNYRTKTSEFRDMAKKLYETCDDEIKGLEITHMGRTAKEQFRPRGWH